MSKAPTAHPAVHPDLEAEQAHLDLAYERLAEMRESAVSLRDSALGFGAGGTHQSRYERDVFHQAGLSRLEALELGDRSLCFGRIDRSDGEHFHIGRIGVSTQERRPLVVDWRAPVAEPFYRATGRHPMGLWRRRHFDTKGRRLLGIEDELFGDGEGLGLSGTGALMSALERVRSGKMQDIVATVQREQDEIIRAPMAGVLVVQGGPGTGKTAVALHRAAYLLFTYRYQLERRGVLFVGPNPVFLRYVDQVLPALGESGVALSTPSGLVPDLTVRGSDSAETARVKGDARMARFVANAVRDRQRPLTKPLRVGFDGLVLTLTPRDSQDIVASVKRTGGKHNARRVQLERLVYKRLFAIYRTAAAADSGRASLGGRAEVTQDDLVHDLRREPEVVRTFERMWPMLSPQELLHDLYSALPLIASAGRGVLSEAECRSLYRAPSERMSDVPWSPGDVPLLDEAFVWLGVRKRKREPGDDEITSYGHVVVDEAQDMSPMHYRMLERRADLGSMTVVGDIAQATSHSAVPSWQEALRHLNTRHGSTVAELSVNYRTTAEIMQLAGRILRTIVPELKEPESVRSGPAPAFVRSGPESLPADVARTAVGAAAAEDSGTVAVICPDSLRPALSAALSEAGADFADAAESGLRSPITLVPVWLAKGLEFDAVVVVEPAAIVEESPQGMRALYVAVTRATKHLSLVHARALPDALREGAAG
ncbi:MAG TPA: ATP-binding domain-containing protein [Actinomycetota bacterium]|nr:ATP-binding domain-containing protein [Actinomycetota bacterium]